MKIETKCGGVRLRSGIEVARMILVGVLAAGCTPAPAEGEMAVQTREHPGAQAVPRPGALPVMSSEVRAAYIGAVQAGAPDTYRVERSGAMWRAPNPAQRFAVDFSTTGVHLEPQGGAEWSFSLHTERYGCEGDLRPVALAEPAVSGNRVDYWHRGAAANTGLVEWYLNGPLGLEQGFTLEVAPPCRAPSRTVVMIELAFSGELVAELDGESAIMLRDASGAVVARYTDLHVSDFMGRVLPSWFSVHGRRITLHVEAGGAVYPVKLDPLVAISQGKLSAPSGVADENFGFSVAVSGDTAVVGAYGDDGNGMDSGSAYVFVRNGTSWTQQAKLEAAGGSGYYRFGKSVAVSKDTAVVGAQGENGQGMHSGSAYVFERDGTSWTQQAKLVASDSAGGDVFGNSVAVSENMAVVGAQGDDAKGMDSGSAYVFVRQGTSWTQQAKLVASDGAGGDVFGNSVAVSENTAVVGAFRKNLSQGSAYIFAYDGISWSEQAKLVASDGVAGDSFGDSVAVSENTVVVGASSKNLSQGSAYIFAHEGISWSEQAKLVASDGVAGDSFGVSVAVSGNTVVVGASSKNLSQGSAYIFAHEGSSWMEQDSQIVASDGAAGDSFGVSIAVSESTALVGAWGKDSYKGSAYAFVLRSINGDHCGGPGSCVSGFCVDGICCDEACIGPCNVCAVSLGASADGTCVTPAGYDNPSCSGFICDGVNTSCPTTCISDNGCSSTLYCAKDGNCKSRQMNGSACNTTADVDCLVAGCRVCDSGFCIDGTCGTDGSGTGGTGTSAPTTNQSLYSCSLGSPVGNPRDGLLAALTGLVLTVGARRRRLSRSPIDVEHR